MTVTLQRTPPHVGARYGCACRGCGEAAEYYLHVKKDRGRATNHKRCAEHAREDAKAHGLEMPR